ncbi:MAG TPA: hypothetical protein V6C97_33720 [Oculatellaceae cyanobacterium]
MSPIQDKRDLAKIQPSENRAADSTEHKSEQRTAESSSESWYSELWHSTKYALVQAPYDGIRQDVNHLTGAFSKGAAPIGEHQFVEPMHWRNDFSAVGIAQDVGSALGTIPYFAAAQMGLKKFMPEKMLAGSVPLLADVRAQNVLRTAVAGGLVDGVLTPVSDDGDWMKNKLKNATTGFTTFAVAGAGMEYLGHNPLASKLASGTVLTDKLSQAVVQRANNFVVGAISGGGASVIGSETGSLIFDHKLAEGTDLGAKSLKTVAMMATLAALGRPGAPNMERISGLPDAKAGDISSQMAKDVPRPIGKGVPTEDPSVPKPVEPAKAARLNDLDPRPDLKQAARLERQATQLEGKGQFGQSAQRLTAAVDCVEAVKSQGGEVDEAHLSELYRRLRATRMRADERGQPVTARN